MGRSGSTIMSSRIGAGASLTTLLRRFAGIGAWRPPPDPAN